MRFTFYSGSESQDMSYTYENLKKVEDTLIGFSFFHYIHRQKTVKETMHNNKGHKGYVKNYHFAYTQFSSLHFQPLIN